jgi:hypothetical protein
MNIAREVRSQYFLGDMVDVESSREDAKFCFRATASVKRISEIRDQM